MILTCPDFAAVCSSALCLLSPDSLLDDDDNFSLDEDVFLTSHCTHSRCPT
jgi:hypothetical protein